MENYIIKAKQGDKESFEKAILIVKNKLYVIAKIKLKNKEDIYDVIQDTLIQSYQNIRSLKDVTKFESWIIKILINNCNKSFKSKSYNAISYDELELENKTKAFDDISISDDNIDFFNIIDFLEYEERMILTLYYYDDYTTKDISGILNTNESTIRSKLKRAKQKIKDKFKEVF